MMNEGSNIAKKTQLIDPIDPPMEGGSGSTIFPPPHPHIHVHGFLIPDPPPTGSLVRVLSRDQCVAGKWGSYLPHTSHPGTPLQAGTQGLRRTHLIRAASTKGKTENDNRKGKRMGFQNWATPPAFIEWVERAVLPQYTDQRFGLDACAEPHNAKCRAWIGPPGSVPGLGVGCIGLDGLNASWANYGPVWCNPGFSSCASWMDKARAEATSHEVLAVVLTHACHGAKWFRQRYEAATALWLVNPRVNFLPPANVEGSSNNRDSYLWVWAPGQLNQGGRMIYPAAWRI